LIRTNVEAMARGHRLDVGRVLDGIDVLDSGADFNNPLWVQFIIAKIQRGHYGFVGVDPLADVIGDEADESSNKDARRINRRFRDVIEATGVTLGYAHHVGKAVEGKSKRDRIRGASAWVNAARVAFWVEATDGGLSVECLKGNRFAKLPHYPLVRTVTTEADGLTWRAARLDMDRAGVTSLAPEVKHILTILRTSERPGPSCRTLRDLCKTMHGMGSERTDSALSVARFQKWVEVTPGPHRASLHQITDAGRARLLLSTPAEEG
jgi:hypothetical protein